MFISVLHDIRSHDTRQTVYQCQLTDVGFSRALKVIFEADNFVAFLKFVRILVEDGSLSLAVDADTGGILAADDL